MKKINNIYFGNTSEILNNITKECDIILSDLNYVTPDIRLILIEYLSEKYKQIAELKSYNTLNIKNKEQKRLNKIKIEMEK